MNGVLFVKFSTKLLLKVDVFVFLVFVLLLSLAFALLTLANLPEVFSQSFINIFLLLTKLFFDASVFYKLVPDLHSAVEWFRTRPYPVPWKIRSNFIVIPAFHFIHYSLVRSAMFHFLAYSNAAKNWHSIITLSWMTSSKTSRFLVKCTRTIFGRYYWSSLRQFS